MTKSITYLGIFFLINLAASSQVLAQENDKEIAFRGKILDGSTGDPLLFASISVKGKTHRTVTNLDGEFDLFISSKYLKDTLVISHIGFETHHVVLLELKDREQLEIRLTEHPFSLDEIQITAERNPIKIMQKARESLVENYATTPFVLEGFFRDIRDQNGQSSYLAEAAVEVYDPGIKIEKTGNRKERSTLYANELRSGTNYINELLTPTLAKQNFLYYTLENNWLKAFYDSNTDDKKWELNDYVYKGDKLLYVISSESTGGSMDNDSAYAHLQFKVKSIYHVDVETYAIHKIEYNESPLEGKYTVIEPPYEGDSLFYCKKGWTITREYQEYDNKMYLKYINQAYPFDIYNKKSGQVYLDEFFTTSFVTTSMRTESVSRPQGKRVVRKRDLMLHKRTYNPTFWNNKQNIKLVPLTQKQLEGLEREFPLEEQFVVSGKKKSTPR